MVGFHLTITIFGHLAKISTLDAALLCSSRVGSDLGRVSGLV